MFPLVAAKASGGEQLLAFGFIIVVAIIALTVRAIQGPAHYDVNIKGGAPYCPRCNRQVSFRRDHCRACGYSFVSYGNPIPPPPPVPISYEPWEGWKPLAALFVELRLFAARHGLRAWRGIKFAASFHWFGSLPEWAQAIVFGLLIAVPAVIAVVMIASRK